MTNEISTVRKTSNYILGKPWYLQTWFIALNFAFSFFVIPFIAGIALLIMSHNDDEEKKKLINNTPIGKKITLEKLEQQLNEAIAKTEDVKSYSEIKSKLDSATSDIEKRESEIKALDADILTLSTKKDEVETELDIQSFGFYNPEFDDSTSSDHKARIVSLKDKQKAMVKNKTACNFSEEFTFNGSLSEGKKAIRKQVKMALWAFNTQCDNVIKNVTYRNVGSSEKKINRAYEIIKDNFEPYAIFISHEYLALKYKELEETHKYYEKLESEKQLLREQRAQEREDKKLQEEIRREKEKLSKDAKHIDVEIKRLQEMIKEGKNTASANKELAKLNEQMADINEKLEEADYRQNHSKAGYVYIISNIGSFGDGVVKIGVTRRLEPTDRIKELGDASVPFKFDTHALVFSENAYKLEHDLHKKFGDRRLNTINSRKEFFRVELDEVKTAIEKEFKATLEFEPTAAAVEYRQGLKTKAGND